MRFCNRKNVIIYFLQKSISHTKDLIWYKNPCCIVNLSWKILYWIYILKSWFPNLFIQCRHQFIWLRAQHFKISRASDWLIEFCNQFYALSRIQINDLNNLKINKNRKQALISISTTLQFSSLNILFISVFYVLEIWVLAFSFLSSNLESRWGNRRTLSMFFIQRVGDF